MPELSASLLRLAQTAKRYDIPLTVDAEEAVRLEISLDVIEGVFCDASLSGWAGFGLAVQSYQKRAFSVLDWVYQLAKSQNRRIMVRLIKGAYWDTEIKQTQVLGLSDYPVFTRKVNTDVSFQACAKKLLGMTDWIYPQFATHNAYSVAVILAMAGDRRDFEFQCLHGMGNELYAQIVPEDMLGIPCRIYAPVGTHEHLLPYLVRRLLENGANSSFVNRLVDEKEPVHALVRSPVEAAHEVLMLDNPNIPNSSAIFLPERLNSQGFDLSDRASVLSLQMRMGEAASHLNWERMEPVQEFTADEMDAALMRAYQAFDAWAETSVHDRACALERYAELLETHRESLWTLLCLEAGKTWQDSLSEVREAIDFCRYYAQHGRLLMSEPQLLQGYTGEYIT